MPYEPRPGSPPEEGWLAFCLTFAGATVGPLVSLALAFALPREWCLDYLLLLPIPISIAFFLGVFAGHWLGTKIGGLAAVAKGLGCSGRGPIPDKGNGDVQGNQISPD
jgi:hypothetical protein